MGDKRVACAPNRDVALVIMKLISIGSRNVDLRARSADVELGFRGAGAVPPAHVIGYMSRPELSATGAPEGTSRYLEQPVSHIQFSASKAIISSSNATVSVGLAIHAQQHALRALKSLPPPLRN